MLFSVSAAPSCCQSGGDLEVSFCIVVDWAATARGRHHGGDDFPAPPLLQPDRRQREDASCEAAGLRQLSLEPAVQTSPRHEPRALRLSGGAPSPFLSLEVGQRTAATASADRFADRPSPAAEAPTVRRRQRLFVAIIAWPRQARPSRVVANTVHAPCISWPPRSGRGHFRVLASMASLCSCELSARSSAFSAVA